MSSIIQLSATQIVVSLLLCASSVGLVYLLNRNHMKRKRQYVKVSKISKIIIYPIKSLPGIPVDTAFVSKSGVKFGPFRDRSWMLVDSDGRFITQRNETTLALLRTSFHGEELWVEGPDKPILKLTVKEKCLPNEDIIQTKVWGQPIEGLDCGKEAEEWFSEYLQKPGTKLIQHIPKLSMRPSGVQVNNEVIKSDKFPIIYQDATGLLVINSNSINDLNDRLSENSKVSYRNFRPNLLVTESEPFDEDKWEFIKIQNVEFTNLKPCDRCVFTTINPDTGIKDSKEPLETLRKYRLAPQELKRHYGESPLFGINLGPENQGQISAGDLIYGVYRK